jgi:hypothetical protein
MEYGVQGCNDYNHLHVPIEFKVGIIDYLGNCRLIHTFLRYRNLFFLRIL